VNGALECRSARSQDLGRSATNDETRMGQMTVESPADRSFPVLRLAPGKLGQCRWPGSPNSDILAGKLGQVGSRQPRISAPCFSAPRPAGLFSGFQDRANRVDSYAPRWQNGHARDNNPPCGCEPSPAREKSSRGRVFSSALAADTHRKAPARGSSVPGAPNVSGSPTLQSGAHFGDRYAPHNCAGPATSPALELGVMMLGSQ
jgi:hypothetical protein